MGPFHIYSFMFGVGVAVVISVVFFVIQSKKQNRPQIIKTITETLEKIVYKDREPTVDECLDLIKKAGRDDLLFKEMTIVDAYQLLKAKQKELNLDPTKRNSLQPSNGVPTMPGEWEQTQTKAQVEMSQRIQDMQKAQSEQYVPHEYHPDLEHKFYGTTVTIGKWSRDGLDKRLHMLEISNNVLYIDQQPQPINPTDLDNIKQVLTSQRELNG